MSLVLDTGPILALLDRDDPDHTRCVDMVRSTREDLVVPAAILGEVDYWCRKLLGVEVWKEFIDDMATGGYLLAQLDAMEVQRAVEIEAQYGDLALGFVDAAVIATCERLGETKVATLDRRHFSIVQPAHCVRLRLLPE